MGSEDIRARLHQRYRDAAKSIKGACSASCPNNQNRATKLEEVAEDNTKDDDDVKDILKTLQLQAQKLIDWDNDPEGVAADDDHILAALDALIETARSKFYSYRLDRLPPVWRDIFSDAHVLKTYNRLLLRNANMESLQGLLDFMSEHLDRAVIVAGKTAGSLGTRWFDETMAMLEEWEQAEIDAVERPAKRARISSNDDHGLLSSSEPFGRPRLSLAHEVPRSDDWTLEKFEDYMNDASRHPRPMIFTNQIQDWPALNESPWASRSYLLSKTFGGRRLVPVEIGRSYVDEGWGQELIPFRVFLETYVDPHSRAEDDPTTVGYLAQHDLFQQLPSLRNDITVPDFCWASVPGYPTDAKADKPKLDYPQLNAWFGPARTITPLHTDGYHNLLCQVVGTKYVRLYPPTVDKEVIRPRGEEMGVSMANTSELDIGVLEGWDEPGDLDQVELDAMRDDFKDVEFWEGVLSPGDTLLIPIGWWHYVRSLSVSFSVSFWWN
jgi:hypothetical protein